MPVESEKTLASPGFQGSETSGCEVTIYPHGYDPVLANSAEVIKAHGLQDPKDLKPQLVSVQTSKSIGGGAGTWSMGFKIQRDKIDAFRESIADDDWVDIVFTRHGRKWHTMRGTVDDIRGGSSVAGSGATSATITVIGRDFQKCWEETPLWFDRFALESIAGQATIRQVNMIQSGAGSDPEEMVRLFLDTFLKQQGEFGRATWNPPKAVPNIASDGSFLSSVVFETDEFTGEPSRIAILPNATMPNGNLWDLAVDWSDTMFTELWTDLAVGNSYSMPGEEHHPNNTQMAVFFRDKPFPLVDASDFPYQGKDSKWFDLPTAVVPVQQIVSHDAGRTGKERYNAFLVSPSIQPENTALKNQLLKPLWHPDDIAKHGFRPMDVTSKFKAAEATLITMTAMQRRMVRDWYGINPYLYNGTLSLGIGRPDIRVGNRVLIPGPTGSRTNWTYYVESVSHQWNYGVGIRTTLGVTRGYQGTDDGLLIAIEDHVYGYEEPTVSGG